MLEEIRKIRKYKEGISPVMGLQNQTDSYVNLLQDPPKLKCWRKPMTVFISFITKYRVSVKIKTSI